MNNTVNTTFSTSTNITTLSSLSPLEQGKSALRRAELKREQDPVTTLDSLDIAKRKFSDVLAQNKKFSYDEKRDIQASLAQACLLRGDILRDFGRIEEARADYMEARRYGAQEAEQRLSSLSPSAQTTVKEEKKVNANLQVVSGLANIAIKSSGNINKLHYSPTDRDLPLLKESLEYHSEDVNAAVSMVSQVPSEKLGDIVFQSTRGVANYTISGDRNDTTVIYGSSSTFEATSNVSVPGGTKLESKELPPLPK
ncbi:Replicative DNA helicase [Mycoavidus cysteinexigens]|uniref:Replicative DNA helicase n=1 Tax=Mycoavidus cysteinexigens TaxID=1553431 RepID=A0A2Z6EX07_9BURK|nr:hypothetical protein [Mycoavidus cysteinexigens]BBE09989.1 Replicative DNA helicase [Mycoavidus cysteinexigens]GAM53667.1 hypothetical protein EBME_2130 [bacterium endosymbiont of Mortierella elongata FMR23-6]GLR02273.1 hypothetical protein GCM10007934_20890 [Mycoavidus cysteinexigens]